MIVPRFRSSSPADVVRMHTALDKSDSGSTFALVV